MTGITTRVEVKGLSQALQNLKTLDDAVQNKITRDALREASWVLAKAGRAATYTTFRRISGAIKAGLSVAVQREPNDEELKAYVVEYPQKGSPFGALAGSKRLRKRSKGGIAFYWRFIEFGTALRKSVRTPRNKRIRSLRPGTRTALSWQRFQGAPSRGSVRPRAWLRPAFQSTVTKAIETFREDVLDAIEQETNAMPK